MGDHNKITTRTIKASEFRTKCLKLIGEVAQSGEGIVIIRRGRPVSPLVPYHEKPKSLFGIDKGRIEIFCNVISPENVEWEAQIGRT